MGFWEFTLDSSGDLAAATLEHVVLVLQGLGLAVLIALPLAALTYRSSTPRTATIAVTGAILTIPSYALFGLLITPLGLGTAPSILALTLYALLPIVRNAIVGLREVDQAAVESARGMGLGRWQILKDIELPIAWPVIITGMRVATQLLLGIAAIAAAVNGPGLGNLILDGLSSAGTPFAIYLTVQGIVGIMLLAVLFDLAFSLLNRITTSRGIRV